MTTIQHVNQRKRRGKCMRDRWSRLRDPELLSRYMDAQDFSQARMARYVNRSRQFIHKLVAGQVRTCTVPVAERIEEALRVLPGTLFVEEKSPSTRTSVARKKTAA